MLVPFFMKNHAFESLNASFNVERWNGFLCTDAAPERRQLSEIVIALQQFNYLKEFQVDDGFISTGDVQ